MKLTDLFKSKCEKCPFALGRVQFAKNPCPQCKANNYAIYHQLMASAKKGPPSGGPLKG